MHFGNLPIGAVVATDDFADAAVTMIIAVLNGERTGDWCERTNRDKTVSRIIGIGEHSIARQVSI